MPMLRVRCPRCNAKLTGQKLADGGRQICPRCDNSFVVATPIPRRAAEPEPEPEEAPRSSGGVVSLVLLVLLLAGLVGGGTWYLLRPPGLRSRDANPEETKAK